MPRTKKTKSINSKIEDLNGIRISYHEKVCAERMKTLFKAIDEMRADIKNLRQDMNKGKGAVNLLLAIGAIITAFIGYFKYNG
jgi:uncharacterized coiled-coil DUF342 family protein